MIPRLPQSFAFLIGLLFVYLTIRIFSQESYLTELEDESEIDEMDLRTLNSDGDPEDVFARWLKCANREMMPIQNSVEFWDDFTKHVTICDSEAEIERLGVISVPNKDEDKILILPKQKARRAAGSGNAEKNNFVTLGIGKDISGELRYRRKLERLGELVDFYGADPLTDVNSGLYSRLGLFFPFAVSGHSGYSIASVQGRDKYYDKSVVHVDFVYFVEEILKIKKIDNLWMDAEGAEYELFDIFAKNGKLDEHHIEICQINIEVHMSETPNEVADRERKNKFMDFVKKMIADERFGVFRSFQAIHIRLYMFNFSSEYCRKRY